ncbi:stability determinant [Pseudomonas sp.]|uniref:type II toxin-antitoxin system RelB family antitoxin n=1 Tax=Pseudomonas sp. TaxID=306 RepID=UPI003A96DFB6
MSVQLSPIVSEFETQEQADRHDRWFRRKVQESLDDSRPGVPHDQVMAEMEAIITQAEARRRGLG